MFGIIPGTKILAINASEKLLGLLIDCDPEIIVRKNFLFTYMDSNTSGHVTIPFDENLFDYVVIFDIDVNRAPPMNCIWEALKALKPEGKLYLSEPVLALLSSQGCPASIPGYLTGLSDSRIRLKLKTENFIPHHPLDSLELDDVSHCRSSEQPYENLSIYSFNKTCGDRTVEPNYDEPSLVRKRPLVSVICLAYNHESFIQKTLSSILSQNTSFPFELIVNDDCSTDSTFSMASAFRSSHWGELVLLRSDKNEGVHASFRKLFAAARGSFIAICDGDDYWTDSKKIQKQYNYLSSHPGVSIVYSDVVAHADGVYPRLNRHYQGGAGFDIESRELSFGPSLNTSTVMFRNVIRELPPEYCTTGCGDLMLWSLLGAFGSGAYLPNILPGVYRQHSGGMHSSVSESSKIVLEIMTTYSLYLYYVRINHMSLANYFTNKTFILMRRVVALTIEGKDNLLDALQRMASRAEGAYNFERATYLKLLNIVLIEAGVVAS